MTRLNAAHLPQRVVVTGMGIVSSIGNSVPEVLESLRSGRGGIVHNPDFERAGFSSWVCGASTLDLRASVPLELQRFMSESSLSGYVAARQAMAAAAMPEDALASSEVAVVAGCAGVASSQIVAALDVLRERGPRRMGKNLVPRCMPSSLAANLSTAFGIQGPSYSLSSACSTSANCIGHAYDLIRHGRVSAALAGGAEELHLLSAAMFDAMGALSSRFNASPGTASRPYDRDRDGFVISSGAGFLFLESLAAAERRGADILCELVAYGVGSDGADMVQPTVEGAARCMASAVGQAATRVDYINTHATSTRVGDLRELQAISRVFGDELPRISSTKGLTGHSLGAAGAHEAIYSILMLRHGFLAACANLQVPDDGVQEFPLVLELEQRHDMRCVMSNSLGFGGANCSLVFAAL